jgi:ABC-type amino acid transport substrate-binding protein
MGSYFLTWYMLFWSVHSSGSKRHLLGNERASLGYNEPFADVDYRQSFCSQYKMAVNNSLLTESALEGRQVNVLISDHRTNYNEETGLDPEYPGLFPKILDEIAELGNFTWRQSFGITEKNDTNKSYSELLKWGTNAYDIYVSDWSITSERINLGSAFTSPVLDSKIIMIRNVGPDGKDKIPWVFWFKPFEWGVWLVFIAQIIVSGFVYQFLDFLGEGRDKMSFRQRTVDNQNESYLSYFNMSYRAPTSSAARLFIISNYIWVMFITAAYGANLTSYMVVTAKSRLVLNTIQDAIENDMSMCIETMTNQEAYITRKYPDAISLLVPKESVRDMYTALNEGECDVVLGERHDYDAYTLKNEFNPDCHLTWQGRPVLESDTGFATLMDPGQKCTLLVSGKHNIFDDTFVFMKLRRPLTCLFSLFHTSKRGVYISLREAKRGWNLSRIMEHGSRE